MTEFEECQGTKKLMQGGKRKILSQFEKVMISDINIYYFYQYEKKKNELLLKRKVVQKITEEEHKITSLPRTMEMLGTWNML